MKKFSLLGTALVAAVVLGGAACSDESRDEIGDAAESVGDDAEQAANAAAVRSAAEAMRASLQAEDLAANETVRHITVLEEAIDDVPGDVRSSGVTDGDGDGKDDDGKVELAVGDERACVTVADNGDVSVAGDACS
jgi:hypothetical protein